MGNKRTSLADCHFISIPEIKDNRGSLGIIESKKHIPFNIARIYFIHSVPSGTVRGEHAHKKLCQVMCAISGSFKIELRDGKDVQTYHLDSPHKVLFICPMIWRRLYEFSDDASCLVLASNIYDPEDYFHDYNDFISQKGIS